VVSGYGIYERLDVSNCFLRKEEPVKETVRDIRTESIATARGRFHASKGTLDRALSKEIDLLRKWKKAQVFLRGCVPCHVNLFCPEMEISS
jgi:hypothetical protein